MGSWVIYASEEQDEPKNWDKFEQGLAASGFRVSCHPDMTSRRKRAFITVRDPLGKLDEWVLGYKRLDLLARRVRGLIKRCNQHFAQEKIDGPGTYQPQANTCGSG